MTAAATKLHASCVAVGDQAVLLRGPSGSGKSSLALRLMDEGAILVADDQTALEVEAGRVLASAPKQIAGLLEVRGLGIVRRPYRNPMPVALVADLMPTLDIPRLPEPGDQAFALGGVVLARISVDPMTPDATARIRLVLEMIREGSFPVEDSLVSTAQG